MGIITKIEEQKNKNRVNIFVDDSFFCGLEKETAIVFGLKTNREIDENELEKAINESEIKRAFEKSISLLERRMNTKFELTNKLKNKGFSENSINGAIEKLEEYHYIDDDLFARLFIEQNHNYSKKMIFNKLMQKGINKEIIEKNLINVDDDLEFSTCLNLAKKLLKTSKLDSFNEKQKFMAKLVRRGFGFDTVKRVLGSLECDVDDFE